MAKIWKSEEFVWKREGFIKKSEEFLWKNDEFVWKSERIYMAQRYSKYRFFDVNCILSILFQVQSWGCPGKPKFQFHILCGRGRLYIYIKPKKTNQMPETSHKTLGGKPFNLP